MEGLDEVKTKQDSQEDEVSYECTLNFLSHGQGI